MGAIAKVGGVDSCHANAPGAGSNSGAILKREARLFPNQPLNRGKSLRP